MKKFSEIYKNFTLNTRFIALFLFLLIVPIILLGYLSYNAAKEETYSQVEEQLRLQALDWRATVEAYQDQIENVKDRENKMVRDQVSSISIAVKKMVELHLDEVGTDPQSLEKLYDKISEIQIGNTGYVYLIDKDGNYVVSKDRIRDGENIWDALDSDGRYFIRELVREGRKLSGDEVYLGEYPWINTGEENARMKIAAITYVPELDVIIGASSYYDELKGSDLKVELIDELKEKIAEVDVGKTGYLWVINSDGEYIVSKDRSRDGENIWNSEDAEGDYFVQEIVAKAKDLDSMSTATQYYEWQNPGESKAYMKVSAFSYFPEWDWIIGAGAYQKDFISGLDRIKNLTVIICITAIIIGAIIVYFMIGYLTKSYITKPLQKITDAFSRLAEQDYTYRLPISDNKDEISKLSYAYNMVVESSLQLIRNIQDNMNKVSAISERLSSSSEEVNASTQQVASTIQQIAKGSQNQSQLVENTTTTLKDLNVSITNISENLNTASESADRAIENAQKGKVSAGQANTKMKNIKDTVSHVGSVVKDLGDKSTQIGKIIDVINNISEQTNLLALNAAIEAARAGEAGKGFAVVSEEIRKLAEESQKATHQISSLIEGIQGSTNQAVDSMTNTIKEVDDGTNVVGEALISLEGISAIISNVGKQVKDVVKLNSKQVDLTNKVNKAMSEVSTVAEQSAAGGEEVSASVEETTSSMQEVASSAQELTKSAEELKNIISKFKIE